MTDLEYEALLEYLDTVGEQGLPTNFAISKAEWSKWLEVLGSESDEE